MKQSSAHAFTIASLIAVVIFTLYIPLLSPTITSDDSGELSGVTATLGIAHSPGYPLYSIVGKITQTIFPFASPAYRANIISALTSALAAGASVYFFLNISHSLTLASLCALSLGVSPYIYNTATETEVYGIVIFLLIILLDILNSDEITPRKKGYLAFYISGLALISHYTAALWLPAVVWKIWLDNNRTRTNTTKGWLANIGFFIMGVSPVIFIIIRAQCIPLYSWEDPQNLKRFWQVITRARYGGAGYLAQGEMTLWDVASWIEKIKFLIRGFEYNFSLVGLLCGLAGIGVSILSKKNKHHHDKLFLLLLLLGGGPAFLIIANVNTGAPSAEALLSRFLYMASIAWLAYIALILGRLQSLSLWGARLVGILIFIWAMWQSLAENQLRRYHFTFYDYAINIIKNSPPETILISDRADEMEFCVSYILRVGRKRPDIKFIDANAGVSKSIYGDDYYKIWGARRLEIRNKVETEIIERATQDDKKPPVFYATFLPEQTTTPKTPFGLLYYSANFVPRDTFPDEVFVIRQPENELRSISIYKNHYFLLGDYYGAISDEKRMMKNYDAIFYRQPPTASLADDKENLPQEKRTDALAYHKAGYYFYTRNKYTEAQKIYETIIKFYPDDVDALLNRGVIAEKMGDLKKAEILYKNATETESAGTSKKALAYYNLGVLYWKEKNYQSASEMFEKAYRLEPSNSTYRYYSSKSRETK